MLDPAYLDGVVRPLPRRPARDARGVPGGRDRGLLRAAARAGAHRHRRAPSSIGAARAARSVTSSPRCRRSSPTTTRGPRRRAAASRTTSRRRPTSSGRAGSSTSSPTPRSSTSRRSPTSSLAADDREARGARAGDLGPPPRPARRDRPDRSRAGHSPRRTRPERREAGRRGRSDRAATPRPRGVHPRPPARRAPLAPQAERARRHLEPLPQPDRARAAQAECRDPPADRERPAASRPSRSTCAPASSSTRDDAPNLEAEIQRDPTLVERQKQALLEIYRSLPAGRRQRRPALSRADSEI